ncbi:energy transducer TonB [Algibacillus agarilyticus]|uniref:energy transducer TonB n=1 Tax=Algibacillus agarilyticus TaxID=2234133 RepID=UPI000DD09A90|nr:energy transducer TonB [Algibacillus agarilyticus]
MKFIYLVMLFSLLAGCSATADKSKLSVNQHKPANKNSIVVKRASPKYPIDAARKGISGWVKMRFDVDATGNVKNIHIIEANPALIFNQSAVNALAPWQYKPKMVEGMAVDRKNLTTVLRFDIKR